MTVAECIAIAAAAIPSALLAWIGLSIARMAKADAVRRDNSHKAAQAVRLRFAADMERHVEAAAVAIVEEVERRQREREAAATVDPPQPTTPRRAGRFARLDLDDPGASR